MTATRPSVWALPAILDVLPVVLIVLDGAAERARPPVIEMTYAGPGAGYCTSRFSPTISTLR